jgi:hypothetical protein
MGDLKTELVRIRQKRGSLTPRVVLEEAKSKSHPLHDRFTWNNVEAGEKWRLHEAAQLLRVTFRTDIGGRPADLREFWVVKGTPESPESQYVPIDEVIQDPISRQIMLRQMLRDWKRFKARYSVYSEFAELVLNDPDFTDPDEEFGNDGDGTDG